MKTGDGRLLAFVRHMPRPPRLFFPGMSQHVIQRGNNRADIFHDRRDYAAYLAMLRSAAGVHDVAVHAYVLMTNHVHLIVTPPTSEALSRAMQDLGRGYVQSFNRTHHRTGTLWEGRYRSTLIQDQRYFFTCHRYVEMNPIRAAMVRTPDIYRWSSYRFHAHGEEDLLITPHALYLQLGGTADERQLAWRTACGAPLRDDELAEMRQPARFARASSTVEAS